MNPATGSRSLAARLVALWLVLSLCSCSALFGHHGYFRDRGEDYVKATEIPPMKVVPPLAASAISELYVIPPISNGYVDSEAGFEAPKPDFKSAIDRTQVKIQSLEQQRWIAMNVTPSEVWPRVQNFLVENKIGIASAIPASGEIETSWLTVKDDPSTHDRYQIRVEQGIQSGSCEIHVIHVTVTGAISDEGAISWPVASVDPEKEKWLLDALANYLTQEDKSGVSLLAQSVGGLRKVDYVQPLEAEPFLVFSLDKARTWASVGGALAQFPFVVKSAQADRKFYDVIYDPTPRNTSKPGFFCRITGCVNRAKKKREQDLQYYRVQMDDSDAKAIKIFVKHETGDALPYPDAEKLLNLIKSRLI